MLAICLTDYKMVFSQVLMGKGQALTEEIMRFEEHRSEYIEIVRELRKAHPNMKMKSLENLAEIEVTNRGPKSRAFYRIQATRRLTGGSIVLKLKGKREGNTSVVGDK